MSPCHPQDFHELAQRCSAPATVHFMHTMNWVRETKGACWVDYLLPLAAALEADDSQAATAKQVCEPWPSLLHAGQVRLPGCSELFSNMACRPK